MRRDCAKTRVLRPVCSQNLFIHDLLIRPTSEELAQLIR